LTGAVWHSRLGRLLSSSSLSRKMARRMPSGRCGGRRRSLHAGGPVAGVLGLDFRLDGLVDVGVKVAEGLLDLENSLSTCRFPSIRWWLSGIRARPGQGFGQVRHFSDEDDQRHHGDQNQFRHADAKHRVPKMRAAVPAVLCSARLSRRMTPRLYLLVPVKLSRRASGRSTRKYSLPGCLRCLRRFQRKGRCPRRGPPGPVPLWRRRCPG